MNCELDKYVEEGGGHFKSDAFLGHLVPPPTGAGRVGSEESEGIKFPAKQFDL